MHRVQGHVQLATDLRRHGRFHPGQEGQDRQILARREGANGNLEVRCQCWLRPGAPWHGGHLAQRLGLADEGVRHAAMKISFNGILRAIVMRYAPLGGFHVHFLGGHVLRGGRQVGTCAGA